MKQSYLRPAHAVRTVVLSALLLAGVGAISCARADDRDGYWRQHQQQERNWRSNHHDHARWDHRYWDRDGDVHDRDVYVYRPPMVYYAPPPPSGLDFVFRFGR